MIGLASSFKYEIILYTRGKREGEGEGRNEMEGRGEERNPMKKKVGEGEGR